ncbi:MAG: EF-P lysine aminoacylase EpmA [bacterium]|nr:EF-P lysine aminoacylase EpmA [bacterium]
MKNWQKIKNEPELLNNFFKREKIINALRQFFQSKNFHEVETPLLVPNPGTEPYLEVFATQLQLQNEKPKTAFLVTSPELQMKKLLAAGLENIFQITKSFRNGEGRSPTHNSEFTILEYYRANATYFDLMTDLDELLPYLFGGEKLTYQGKNYDLSQGCLRISVKDAFAKYAHITEKELLNRDLLCARAAEKGYQIDEHTTWEEAYNQIFLNEIEPNLGQDRPTIIYDYPRAQAALAKLCDDKNYAQRLEVYLAGLELGNGFGELTDAAEQENRCLVDLRERERLGKTAYDYDHDFIEALANIDFPAAGIAIGVDRLIMLAADVADITQITFFPTTEIF